MGDGKINEPNDGLVDIEVPQDLLILSFNDPINSIVESAYFKLLASYKNEEFLQCRAILSSTIDVVDKSNNYVLDFILEEEKEFLSSESFDRTQVNDNQAYECITLEFFGSLRTSGLPNHMIKLKVVTPNMLLRNMDEAEGLYNGTRLIATRLSNHFIEAKIMFGKNIGNIVYIS
ncbi:uncharacterized protein LOC131619713 [Vicia villosa]|uniref:uncharacterized protein LOC131619713 n=1 Tax=Vicia villosa TaxID=3911 RepID=UPI00273AF7AD|nr:uncharacterized protein LOC131619713 [Vicia villosa]